MKKIIIFLLLLVSTSAHALTIDYETITGEKRSGQFWWGYSYDIALINDILNIDVDIKLLGAATSLVNRWESGIESIWSTDRFAVPILFNVDFVTDDWDYLVRVVDGPGRWDMGTWHTNHYSHERVAAHEFGHMISLFDEYWGGAVDPSTGSINTGGLMAALAGDTLDYYYDPFLEWYESKLEVEPIATPEPGTVVLLGIGLIGLIVGKRRLTCHVGK